MNLRPLQLALVVALTWPTLSCSAPEQWNGEVRGARDRDALASIDAAHRAELRAFEAERARVRREVDLTEVRDFGPAGQLHLRDVELIGWPSAAYLRVEFTYVNSGRRTKNAPQVTLAVADTVTEEMQSVSQDLLLPLGIELGSESTYSSWLEVPVGDLHRRAGWRWDIRVEPRR